MLTEASAVVLSFFCWTPQSEPLTPTMNLSRLDTPGRALTPTMDQSERPGPSREFETLELGLRLPWLGGSRTHSCLMLLLQASDWTASPPLLLKAHGKKRWGSLTEL